MALTLNELIEALQEALEDHPDLGDQEINIAYQQNYPLAAYATAVSLVDQDNEDDECECETDDECDHQGKPRLWIATTDQYDEPYAPKAAWRERTYA
jgi:hypothetical protein